jgi:uncharacterized protein (TIRG00374 family)
MRLLRYLGLIGLIVFLFIVFAIGPSKIIGIFLRLNPLLFSIALIAIVPSVLLKAFKQALLVNTFAVKLSLFDSARIWLIGFFFSIISPGRSGDLVKSFYFASKTGVVAGKGLTAVVIERFFDVAALFLLSLIGFAIVSFHFILEAEMILPLLLFFMAFLALVFILTKKEIVLFFAKPFYRYLIPKRLQSNFKGGFNQFFEGVAVYKAKKLFLLMILLLTFLCWIVGILQYYLIANSLGLNVSFVYLLAVMPIVELLSVLPIAFSGIGTREAGLIFFLGLVGITADSAVSFSLLILFCALLLGLTGFIFFQGEKKVRFAF